MTAPEEITYREALQAAHRPTQVGLLRLLHRRPVRAATHPVTVGVGNHTHIPWVWDHVELVSVHIYQAFENAFQIEIDATKKLARGKPLVLTETVMSTMASTPPTSCRWTLSTDDW